MTRSFFAPTTMTRLLEFGLVFYIVVYAFEGPIRYVLFKHGLDNAILIRDALLMLLLLPVLLTPNSGKVARPYFLVFLAIIFIHGLIIYLNFGNIEVVGYGAKEFLPILFGAVLARLTGKPSTFLLVVFAVLLVATIVGLILDKYLLSFPWTGLSTEVGGFTVEVARSWDATGIDKRVGGFTRSSINAGIFVPLLSIMLMGSLRHWLPRLALVAIASGSVWLTTQKGPMVACALVTLCLVLSARFNRPALRSLIVLGLVATVALPNLFSGYVLTGHHGSGNFSLNSFALRLAFGWPQAFQWIEHNQIFPFGVGLGGIGGAQRLYSEAMENPADNMFLFLDASFGVMAVIYVGFLVFLSMTTARPEDDFASVPIAIIAYHATAGAVISVIEDQSSCIFLGMALGYMLYARSVQQATVPQEEQFGPAAAPLYG